MKKTTSCNVILAFSVLHGAVSIITYQIDAVVALGVAALPWSIAVGMISMLIVHVGNAYTLEVLLLMCALFNTLLMSLYGLSRRQSIDQDDATKDRTMSGDVLKLDE